jgi:RNA polymerase sigma-70 factor (ECF subfamily)
MQANKHISDEELLYRIKCDDSKALKILFERHFSALCSFAFRFVKTGYLAEEVVSDVFLNIWLKKNKIEIKMNLKTYLYTAVRNQSLNYLKKQNPSFEDIETAEKENVISERQADSVVIHKELINNIDTLLRQLPEKRQIIFRLNRIDGLSYKEIAEILSISVHTVQNQMVEAVKFLAKKYPHHT